MGAYYSSLNAAKRRADDAIEYDPDDPEGAVRVVVDRKGLDGFKWRVWWVAASGFFTTSYSIFATNTIGPALNYVYPEEVYGSEFSFVLNLTTLGGTMLGMLVFGVLADRYGRKSVYGLELALVVVATIGLTTASTGKLYVTSNADGESQTHYAMNIYGWIGFWRCLLGIGLGAEYPLSAVIAAEWSSTRSRGTMMAAVFLMQSLGQLAAYALGLAILAGYGNQLAQAETQGRDEVERIIDMVWRLTIGIGAIPALISLFLRRIIPETPLFLAAQGKVNDAAEAAGVVYAPEYAIQPREQRLDRGNLHNSSGVLRAFNQKKPTMFTSTADYISQAREYLGQKGRWRALLGVMITWGLLDLAYYGLGLDNPRTIATIWLWKTPDMAMNSSVINNCTSDKYHSWDQSWRVDEAQPCISIYNMLKQDSIRNIITVSSGTVTGSVIILFAINYIPRTTWMAWMFVALGALFAITGGTFFVTFETDMHSLTITLYVLAQVIFNLGPNTMTFILPAELFGTKWRATFYGLAAASGKLGAIIIQVIVNKGVFKDDIISRNNYQNFAGLLLGFCPAMLLGAFVTWTWIPEVQHPRGHGYSLNEDLDENMSDDGRSVEVGQCSFREQLKLPNRPLEEIDQTPDCDQSLGMRRNLGRLLFRSGRKKKIPQPQPLMTEIVGGMGSNGHAVRAYFTTEEFDIADGHTAHNR